LFTDTFAGRYLRGMINKIQHGQFYTQGNCFKHKVFKDWLNSIPNLEGMKIIEPFAGSNNIIRLIDEAGLTINHAQWGSYDIQPEAITTNTVPSVTVLKRDTLADFPEGYEVCITNPPYLAKNSAKRKGMPVNFGAFQDLFEVSLAVMLANSQYVAAIIPESFISRQIFTERLAFVISLNYQMFEDTDFPVCLAVFNPEASDSFNLYVGDALIGDYLTIKKDTDELFDKIDGFKVKFNDPSGEIGLKAVDSTTGPSISFIKGDLIPSSDIKVSSRAITRISVGRNLNETELALLLTEVNNLLVNYRKTTQDIFMTSFKGLRKDGYYRRRADFAMASMLLQTAMKKLKL
jgi:hypothetical protein